MLTFQKYLSYNQITVLEKALAAIYLLIKLSEIGIGIALSVQRGGKEVKEKDFIK